MRLKLEDAKIYANDFTIETSASEEMEISIGEGSIDIDTSWISKECAKAEREKVWEAIKDIVFKVPPSERLIYFGVNKVYDIVTMPVDRVLDMHKSWKKANSAEEIVKNLKPQDVVYIKGHYCEAVFGLVTRVNICASYTSIYIVCSNGYTDNFVFPDDIEHIEKIGHVVETTDILGEIKKIEDEWRKNSCRTE